MNRTEKRPFDEGDSDDSGLFEMLDGLCIEDVKEEDKKITGLNMGKDLKFFKTFLRYGRIFFLYKRNYLFFLTIKLLYC